MNRPAIGVLCALAIAVAGCGKKVETPKPTAAPPPVSTPAPAPSVAPAVVTLSNIMVGNAIGPDKKVLTSLATLGKNDTIYASVDTMGSGTAALKAKWTYLQPGEATVVKEESLIIDAAGPATSEFHISKPDGWPAGEYQVDLFVDDVLGGTRRFTVN